MMSSSYVQRLVQRFPLAYIYLRRMPAEQILARLKTRSNLADEMLITLKQQLADLRKAILKKYYDAEISLLKSQNASLKLKVEEWRNRLIEAETRNGIEQIIPFAVNCSNEIEHNKCQKGLALNNITPNVIETKEIKAEKCNKKTKEGKVEIKKEKDRPLDVSLLDFRIGFILSAAKHPDADSLYVEQIDVGEERPRTVVSGLVKHVSLDDMQNRMVVVLCNLKPAKMRGILSEAMVMCASSASKVEILSPPLGCIPGERVQFEGYIGAPETVLNPKKQIFEKLAPDLKTNSDCIATYQNVPFEVKGKGVVTALTLANTQIK